MNASAMLSRPALVLAGALTVMCLTGCGSSQDELAAFVEGQRLPVSGHEYRVLPPDMITIRSVHVPEINGVSERIRPDGYINLPLLGEVDVAGKTPEQIEAVLMERSQEFYELVDATVSVSGYNSQQIYIFGQVGRPGPMAWTGTNTLLDVLAQAQPTTLAWPQRIRVVRGELPRRGGYLSADDIEKRVELARKAGISGTGTAVDDDLSTAEDLKAKVMTVDMKAMVESGDLSHNVLLQPDDVVFVPANPLAAVGLAIQQLLFPVRPGIETIGLPSSAAGAAVMP